MKNTTFMVKIFALLAGVAAGVAGLVGFASLTRIAGEKLGFPEGLEWTFTASVDVASVAGAILWSASRPRTQNRRTGIRLNVACSLVSAAGVGLDHASEAAPASHDVWAWVAFFVGAFMPLLSTWVTHGLAKVAHGDKVERDIPTKVRATKVERVEPDVPAPVKATATITKVSAARTPAPRTVTAKTAAPAVELTKRPAITAATAEVEAAPVPAGLHVVHDRVTPADWATEHWPTDWEAVVAATGCSRSTAFRAIGTARKRKEGDDAQLA